MSTTALTTAGRSLVRRGRPNRPSVDNAFASSWCPHYGVRFKLVRCGDKYGEIKPIEAEYLEPEIHSLMEVSGYTVRASDCSRLILLVDKSRRTLKGSFVLRYIEWGESKGWHKGATCAARVTEDRSWYDLTGHVRGAIFWPKSQQYKHAAPSNHERLQANCNLYDVTPRFDIAPHVLAGILNSTWAVLSKFQYGRPVGNEGNLKTEVVDVTMMPIPDPRGRPSNVLDKVSNAFKQLETREAQQFLSERRMRRMALTKVGREAELGSLPDICELDMKDRRDLDDAVLEVLGVRSRQERNALNDNLYAYLREFFEQVRQKEEKAITNKNKSNRKGVLSPTEIAAQIFSDLKDKFGHLLRPYRDFVNLDEPFSTFDLPADGIPEQHQDMFATKGGVRFVRGKKQLALVETKTPEQAALIGLIAANGVRGLVRVPLDPKKCGALQQRYDALLEDRAEHILKLVAERTTDLDLQESIFNATNDLILHGA